MDFLEVGPAGIKMGKLGRLASMCHGEMGKDLEGSLLGSGGFGSDRR